MGKEIIEEINVEWDMESYPFPVIIIKTAPKDEEVNGWMITAHWSHESYECRGNNNGKLLSY